MTATCIFCRRELRSERDHLSSCQLASFEWRPIGKSSVLFELVWTAIDIVKEARDVAVRRKIEAT